MADSTLFETPPALPVTCDRCGRVFEAPVVVDGKQIAGHPKGDPKLCVPLPTMAQVVERDARRRRANRRGKA
jgi:hypothetical protein